MQERLDALWDWDDPAGSEARFREAAEAAKPNGREQRILLTQVARAAGLQDRFDEAFAILDALARAADQDHELDGLRAAEVDQRVERGAGRPPGVEHVVHEQDAAIIDGERNVGAADHRLRSDRMAHQVVAIQGDVEGAGRHLLAGDLAERAGNAPRERNATFADADERQISDRLVAFENFVRDAGEGAADAVRIHDDRHMTPLCGLAGPRLKRRRQYT